MKKSSKSTPRIQYEPGKVILMSVIIAVLTIVTLASIGVVASS
jgi:hypothetical protein